MTPRFMLPVHRKLANFREVCFRLLSQDFENGSLSGKRLAINEVQNLSLRLAGNSAMRRLNKAFEVQRMPVVTASHPVLIIHALLHDDPLAVASDNEAMEIELKTIANGVVIDPGGKSAGSD